MEVEVEVLVLVNGAFVHANAYMYVCDSTMGVFTLMLRHSVCPCMRLHKCRISHASIPAQLHTAGGRGRAFTGIYICVGV